MTLARALLFVLGAFVLAVFYLPLGHDDFAGRWGEGTYGVVLAPNDPYVNAVLPASPAARAGVKPGDRILLDPFTLAWMRLNYPHAGDAGSFPFARPGGAHYTAAMRAIAEDDFNWWSRLSGILAIIPASVFFVIAFAIVYLRPSVMTWSFFVYAVGFYSTGPAFHYFHAVLPSNLFLALTFVLITVLGSFAVLPLLPFLLRFPDDNLTGFRRSFDRVLWVAIGLAYGLACLDWYHATTASAQPWFLNDVLNLWLPLATFVTATIMLAKKYKHASPELRQRFGFLRFGLIVSFLAYAVYFIPGISSALKQIIGYAVVVMPISVAYAVLRHRVLDVNFVLNRALVYGALSVLVIAFVSLLDWLASRVVSGQRWATGLELFATIAIGFLLDRINRGVGGAVESVFFRARRRAEQYLRRAAAALPYATQERAVWEGLVNIPVDALHLTAAALYRRTDDGARFENVSAAGDADAPPSFDRNDLLVRMLQASEAHAWLEELRTRLETAGGFVLAVPVTVRHELASFTLYGAHQNGSQLDPEEVALLGDLAREASRAYDHIEAVRTRERYAAAI